MQTRSDDFADVLQAKTKNLPLVVWIHGDEELLQIEAANTYRSICKAQGFTERVVITVDRFIKPDAMFAHTQALSLFAERKLVEVRFSGKPNKDWAAALTLCAQDLSQGQDTALLVSSPKLDRATTSTSWFTQLEKCSLVVAVFNIEQRALGQWIEDRLRKHGLKASASTLRLISARVEGNLMAADQEIRKLALLFAKPDSGTLVDLPEEDANQAVMSVARYDVFDAVNAMVGGDSARLIRTLQGLQAEGEAGPFLLWVLSDAIRSLMNLRDCIDRRLPLNTVMQRLRIYPPRDRLFEQAARRCSIQKLEESLAQAAQVERLIKGAARSYTSTGVWANLEELALRISKPS